MNPILWQCVICGKTELGTGFQDGEPLPMKPIICEHAISNYIAIREVDWRRRPDVIPVGELKGVVKSC